MATPNSTAWCSRVSWRNGGMRIASAIRVLVFAGSRQVYGSPRNLPVDEVHRVGGTSISMVFINTLLASIMSCSLLGRVDAVVLRLTNVYGPRMALNNPCQGFSALS